MRTIRSHVNAPLATGQRLALPDDVSLHLLRVLRLQPGDRVRLFNGDGCDYEAQLLAVGKRGAEAEVGARIAVQNESPLRITLVQGIARGEKMDLVLQKATELGVAAIVPVVSERTEVKLDAERAAKRLAHWRGIVIAACEQCGRARVPDVAEPVSLARYAASADAESPATAGARLVLDPRDGRGIRELALAAGADVVMVAGPEGGLAPRDLEILHAAGFSGLRLGPRILRTETAGLAALAALQALYGDLG